MKLTAINKNKEFQRGYKRGKSFVSPLVVLYVIKSRNPFTRIGITASKKVGNAVKRNRAKRLLKESLRHLVTDYSKSIDIILVARAKTAHSSQQLVEKDLKDLLIKAGLVSD